MSSQPFERVAPVVRFPDEEAAIRGHWERQRTFERVVEKRRGAPRWIFYEGPPTANGLPHNGHVLTRVIKDLFIRYKTMRGYDVPRKAGWDTHGLPVEIEVEKELGISGRDAIRAFGVEPFARRCLASVQRYIDEWRRFSDDIGFWLDHENHYATYQERYVESVWWALAELHRRGLLYRGHKVLWWWAQGGTALSAAEVGEGYRSVDDPSIYVRLPLASEPDTSLLVWTTTPWTLPSNAFAAVSADVDYAIVEDGAQRLVVAEIRVSALAEKVGRELRVIRTLRGRELVGERYTPPFDWYAQTAPQRGLFRVVEADFIDLEVGTGLVHEAPAFGDVDFEVLRRLREREPDLPLLCAVRPDGGFDPEVAPPAYAGRWVKDCDSDLVAELRERGLLWHAERIRHDYPFCVRSDDDPLIQYVRPAWYVRTTAHVREALANNAEIRWVPEHIRDGRFGDFLRNNVDWALSRERFWGTPLNIWINDETGREEVLTSVAEILERNPRAFDAFEAARRADPSLAPDLRVHKPWIDEVSWQRPGEPGTYRRVPEVIDAWFDAGAMPFAQWGYPHRNQEAFVANFPADFISEAIDQTRGWFNSLLWISTLLFEKQAVPHPYKSCVVLGHVSDREGKKESKSKGNYTPPDIILGRVRLEFAVTDRELDGGPKPGEALICSADYEGLNLAGSRVSVRAYRDDRPDASVEIALRPSRSLAARRQIALHPQDRDRLGVGPGPEGVEVSPSRVPMLPAEHRVWIEDPTSSAPGADAFRWFFCSVNQVWNPTRHSLGAVRAAQRELPLKLRNVYAFFTIYANIDGFDPSEDACRAGRRPAAGRAQLDRWILSELSLATRAARDHLDGYRVYEATGALSDFTDALSNWYVRRSRDRFWAPGLGPDKLDAHWTLYECLIALAKEVAPFLPFAAEAMWQNLWCRPFPDSPDASVHLCDYPEPDANAVDPDLSRVMRVVRELVSLGQKVRTEQRLRVRQPLEAAEVVLAEPQLRGELDEHVELIRDELNVHAVHFVPKADEMVRYRVTPNFRALGPRVGKHMPELKRWLGEADGAALLHELESQGRVEVELSGERLALGPDDLKVSLDAIEGFAAASGPAGVVVLRTAITPELAAEGRFREVLNRVQSFRKELDLEYTGRIRLTLAGADRLLDAVRPRAEHLARETLALDIRLGSEPPAGAHVREAQIDGEALRIGLTLG
jgi:isoleucyl-tRNA synthetase